MKRLEIWDLVGTMLVAAIALPYVGYLVRGTMPFIPDARGMAATGFVLGVAVVVAAWHGSRRSELSSLETALGLGALVLGVVALAAAETVAAGPLLAVFMVVILATWAVEILQHTGLISNRRGRSAAQ